MDRTLQTCYVPAMDTEDYYLAILVQRAQPSDRDQKHLLVTVDPTQLCVMCKKAVTRSQDEHRVVHTPVGMVASKCPAGWKLLDAQLGNGVVFSPDRVYAGVVGFEEIVTGPGPFQADFLAPLLPMLNTHNELQLHVYGQIKAEAFRELNPDGSDVLRVREVTVECQEHDLVEVQEDDDEAPDQGASEEQDRVREVFLVLGYGDVFEPTDTEFDLIREQVYGLAALRSAIELHVPAPSVEQHGDFELRVPRPCVDEQLLLVRQAGLALAPLVRAADSLLWRFQALAGLAVDGLPHSETKAFDLHRAFAGMIEADLVTAEPQTHAALDRINASHDQANRAALQARKAVVDLWQRLRGVHLGRVPDEFFGAVARLNYALELMGLDTMPGVAVAPSALTGPDMMHFATALVAFSDALRELPGHLPRLISDTASKEGTDAEEDPDGSQAAKRQNRGRSESV